MNKRNILITGGAGFIGSHLVKHFVKKYPEYKIINYDSLTYAGNLNNLTEIKDYPNYEFVNANINDKYVLRHIFSKEKINGVIHLAAESHVDRSISNPLQFIETNVLGTVTLLDTAKYMWMDKFEDKLFYHVSTDEVYGSLGEDGYFTETTPYDPKSPYSASKASSDHFVRAYHNTYGLPIVISNCSNNYGPNQFPEKLIPLCINNIKNNESLPIYGDGKNIRDWLHVSDHVKAIDTLFHNGKNGDTYNIGGLNELTNIDLVNKLCDIVDQKLNREIGCSRKLIKYVKNRAGHDYRYAIDTMKIFSELGWTPEYSFETGIEQTVEWYLNNQEWLDDITSGEYKNYYLNQYK